MAKQKAIMVIAIGGPPHSGKSVFLAEFYRQALAQIGSEVFLQRVCPDGEGMWSAEADQELVREIRVKGDFTPEVINFYLFSIEGLKKTKKIVLIDLGGLKSLENILILAHCSDIIILSSEEKQLGLWTCFAQELKTIVRAIKNKDIDILTKMQQEGIIDIIPPSKLVQFETEELLRLEITQRLQILYDNFESIIESLPENSVNVLAQLGSRLLTEEQRQEVDALLREERVLPSELISSINTSQIPWQGEMVDLDRERPSATYREAIGKIVDKLDGINSERLKELKGEIPKENNSRNSNRGESLIT